MSTHRGFTLVELMVALSVITLVLTYLVVNGVTKRQDHEYLEATIHHGRKLVEMAETVRQMAKTTSTTDELPTGVFSHTRPTLPQGSSIQDMLDLYPGSHPIVTDKTPWGTSYTVEIASRISKVTARIPIDLEGLDIPGAVVTSNQTESEITFYPQWSIKSRNSTNARARFVRDFLMETPD